MFVSNKPKYKTLLINFLYASYAHIDLKRPVRNQHKTDITAHHQSFFTLQLMTFNIWGSSNFFFIHHLLNFLVQQIPLYQVKKFLHILLSYTKIAAKSLIFKIVRNLCHTKMVSSKETGNIEKSIINFCRKGKYLPVTNGVYF